MVHLNSFFLCLKSRSRRGHFILACFSGISRLADRSNISTFAATDKNFVSWSFSLCWINEYHSCLISLVSYSTSRFFLKLKDADFCTCENHINFVSLKCHLSLNYFIVNYSCKYSVFNVLLEIGFTLKHLPRTKR